MTVDLKWNGTDLGATSYPLRANYAKGDVVPISVQVTTPVTTIGLYTYTLTVSFSGGSVATQTITGDTFVVNENSSPFGAGWSFSPLAQLVPISTTTTSTVEPYPALYGGVLAVAGDGCPISRNDCHILT